MIYSGQSGRRNKKCGGKTAMGMILQVHPRLGAKSDGYMGWEISVLLYI